MSDVALSWTKSSFCADQACIEVAACGERVLVRDGKRHAEPYLSFARADWHHFLDGIVSGEFLYR